MASTTTTNRWTRGVNNAAGILFFYIRILSIQAGFAIDSGSAREPHDRYSVPIMF
nr:hypothetical protein [Candidatus Sigynarchaeota archaeon]